MGMENLLNYYFIMKKRFVTVLLACSLAGGLFAQQPWFKDKDLTLTGAYYYPEHWDESQWERDFKQMHDLGFEFTHFAEFAWAQLEPEEGKYDFSWLDKAVALAAKYDLKVIMCTSTATPPVWLSRKYPEILIKNENGTVLDHGARQHASFASPVYRELAYKMIEKLAQHYGNDSRIIGWQLDNEPAVQFDYNPKAELAFRDFLREKYHHDIKALNDAWGTAFWSEVYSSFDEITLPKTAQMFMNHHQILDYRRFAASQTNDFLNEQCLLIKKYAKNQWVTTNYIPNYEEGHIGGSPALDFQSYTRYMVYGDNEGIGRRGYRVGNPLRIAFANDFFRPIQGTYGVMELQPGQVNWGSINPQPLPGAVRLWMWSVFAGGGDFICTYRYRQPLYGTEQYRFLYQTDPMWTADGKYLLFRSSSRGNDKEVESTLPNGEKRKWTPTQIYFIEMATGKIIQATEGPNLGSAFLANKTNRMFVSRKEKENWNMYVMDLNKFFADVKQGKVGKPSAYETFIGTFPTEMGRPGGYAVDCNDDYAYITVEREGTEEEKERMMKNAFLPESNQPVKIKPTLCGIRKMNLSTGEVTKVIDTEFKTGHIQASRFTPGEIVFCNETGGDAHQRMWFCTADGTVFKPLYKETPLDWVTHETFATKDFVYFNILGFQPRLRKQASGIVRINLRTDDVELIGQVELEKDRQAIDGQLVGRGFWHCNASRDNKWAAGDTFGGNVWLVNVQTGERHWLASDTKMKPDHAHPSFSPDGTKVLFQSGHFTNGKRLNLMMVDISSFK